VADLVLQRIRPQVSAVHARAQEEGFADVPVPLDVRIELPTGRVLTGTVAGVAGDVLQTVTYSRVSPDHRLAAWVRLLALTASDPERPYNAITIGRARARDQGSPVTVARIPLLGGSSGTAEQRRAFAMDHLVDLVALYDRGMTEPLPVYAKTSAAYASGDRNARKLAEEQWVGEWDRHANQRRRGECKIEEHVRVLGQDLPFEGLFDAPPRDDEAGEGWEEDESSRFGRYARRWWRDLPRRERLSDR
jgi:exodeoxyribonuclease V gamma subunit